ncbi:MAG TPA: hypothetical protein VFV75_08590 [Candidatus Polarisedimenticolaceae bacterium]|nr:hypothetical protein [Candidatus Polarisedimenticolaceae bacterium]
MGEARELEAPRRRAAGSSSSRRRYFYFGLAAVWGYGLGILVVVAALARGPNRVEMNGELALWLALGSLLGLAGGGIVAGAYREARRRHS